MENRIYRNNSTMSAREIWEAVDAAADKAPETMWEKAIEALREAKKQASEENERIKQVLSPAR